MSLFKVTQIRVGGFDHNFSYLTVADNGDAAIIDPCGDAERIHSAVSQLPAGWIPRYLLVTHAHNDHVSALEAVKRFFPAPVAAWKQSRLRPDILLKDRMLLPFGNGSIECLYTPGHTDDSVCFRLSDDSALFTGDTLFIDCCGYCEPETMFRTMRTRLFPLSDKLIVYSGHDYGHVPFESLGIQKQTNVYLATMDFPSFEREIARL